MGRKFLHFIKYNNAFTVGFAVLTLSFGGALAASPDLREGISEAVISSEVEITSIDNSYIINKDLDTYTPRIEVTNVDEDDFFYYVTYTLDTIDLDEGVWKDVLKEKQIKVEKEGFNEDLGLYVTEELNEVIARELSYLKEVQISEIEKGESTKVVATVYDGLVGKFLDRAEEEFAGYDPVIELEENPDFIPATTSPTNNNQGNPSNNNNNNPPSPPPSGDTEPPTITILGNNPALIETGASYNDLGAIVTDNVDANLGLQVEGVEAVDTSVVGDYTIYYSAVDNASNFVTLTRTVTVFDPNVGGSGTSSPPDTTAPVITLTGAATVQINKDDVYTDDGATAVDDVDGDLTGSIVTDNQVDTSTVGTYSVTYNVSDVAGNAAVEVARSVEVIAL